MFAVLRNYSGQGGSTRALPTAAGDRRRRPAGDVLSLPNLLGPLLPSEGVPALVVVYSGVALGVAGLVAAAAGGLWMLKKWGVWLAVVVCAHR